MRKTDFIKLLDRRLGTLVTHILPKASRPIREPLPPQTILLVRPGGIGDALLLAASVAAIRARFPGVAIDVLAEQRNAGAFDLIPGLRQIFVYDRRSGLPSVLGRRYDVVIDTEQWHHLSAVVCRLTRSEMKIGFSSNSRARLFSHPVSYDLDCYEVQTFLDLLAPLGIHDADPAPPGALVIPGAAHQKAAELLHPVGSQPLIVLFAGASIPEKRWAMENFRALIDWCLAEGFSVAMVGGTDDDATNNAIAAGRAVLNLAGCTNLAGTAAVLDRAVCVVSGDSGILHLAAGINRPTVALFGPSNARKWAPRGPGHKILETALACSPCSKYGYTPQCNVRVRCLTELTHTMVCKAIAELITPSIWES